MFLGSQAWEWGHFIHGDKGSVKLQNDEVIHVIDENDKIKLYNIKYKPYCFNGSKVKHGTNDFEGTRHSLIFYKY